MNLYVKDMDENLASDILRWQYEQPYDFYNNEVNEEGITELLEGSYKVVTNEEGELFGFFCTGEAACVPIGNQFGVYNEQYTDMGLGMNPKYVGNGYGYGFCSFILAYIKELNHNGPIRLSVATFNKRAIRLYENLGFVKRDKFSTNSADFITMIKKDE